MLFSSIPFLYFFIPAVILLYFIVPNKFKNFVLLLSSLFFYAWGERKLVFLFAFSIFLGWVLGLLIEKYRGKGMDKLFLWLSVIIDLGLLGYFKYADFFISGINSALGISIPLLRIALPIGISFYTFQILSYTIDVYRGDVSAQRNIIDFSAYVALFPQLIAGPIVRYSDVATQLKTRTHSTELISKGIQRFLIGLGKKVFIANALGELTSKFRASNDLSVLFYWIYAIAFMLQIYFDFSGYSDMAIGLGKIFGFRFIENFNYPYISKSITEFWRRWHISLGSWFRDYVYIPLGGNRNGTTKQIFNIFVVWMLTGLWHGADWNFVLWGTLYAILLTAEKLGFKKWLDKHDFFGHIYVLFTVLLGFVLFNASSISEAINDIKGMFSFVSLPLVSAEAIYYLRSYGVIIIIAIIGATPFPKQFVSMLNKKKSLATVLSIIEPVALMSILLVVTAYLVDGSFNPFLYFRF